MGHAGDKLRAIIAGRLQRRGAQLSSWERLLHAAPTPAGSLSSPTLLQTQQEGSAVTHPTLGCCQNWEPRGFCVTLATVPCLPLLSPRQGQVIFLPRWQRAGEGSAVYLAMKMQSRYT